MSSDEDVGEEDLSGAAAAADPGKKGPSKGLGLMIQKKLMGMTIKSKEAAKNLHMIDDKTSELLDVIYEIARKDLGDEKLAKKILKDLIKIVVKLGLLYRHNQFSPAELEMGTKLTSKFKMLVLTAISYHDVEFTFDALFLSNLAGECKGLVQAQIAKHLTDKSKGRVENVFGFIGSAALLTKLYSDPEYKVHLENLIGGLNYLVTEGKL